MFVAVVRADDFVGALVSFVIVVIVLFVIDVVNDAILAVVTLASNTYCSSYCWY